MKTVVAAPDELWDELKATLSDVECVRVNSASDFIQFSGEKVFFDLFDDDKKITTISADALLFINSPIATLMESKRPPNTFRLNCWSGFIKRSKWEIVGNVNEKLSDYLRSVKKEFVSMPDVPGFVSTRILSMIINEAYFALAEGVSTKEEIDIAMKLGTNYPKGPFEWSREIGLNKVRDLLETLSEHDSRYSPAPLLVNESAKA